MVIILKRKKLNSHLTLEARLFIEEELNQGTGVTQIAKKLNRDCSNIFREILQNRTILMPTSYGDTSCCIHKDICRNRHIFVIKLVKNLN